MQNGHVQFFHSSDDEIKLIYCKNSKISYPRHTHVASYTLGLIFDGVIEIVRDDNVGICNAGDFFVIPPNMPHSFLPAKDTYSMLAVCLGADFVNKQEDTMLQSIQALTANLETQGLIARTQISMLEDAVEVLHVGFSGNNVPESDGVRQTKELLEGMPESWFSIDLLAKQVFISPYHLIRTFKEQFGLTPHQFQMQRRIRKAQQLLLQRNTIAEVALATGFCDQSHFDRWFCKIMGISPSEYIHVQRQLP